MLYNVTCIVRSGMNIFCKQTKLIMSTVCNPDSCVNRTFSLDHRVLFWQVLLNHITVIAYFKNECKMKLQNITSEKRFSAVCCVFLWLISMRENFCFNWYANSRLVDSFCLYIEWVETTSSLIVFVEEYET